MYISTSQALAIYQLLVDAKNNNELAEIYIYMLMPCDSIYSKVWANNEHYFIKDFIESEQKALQSLIDIINEFLKLNFGYEAFIDDKTLKEAKKHYSNPAFRFNHRCYVLIRKKK